MITDNQRIDYLQFLLEKEVYTGRCILRKSSTGRGFRLHETSRADAYKNVRQAIDAEIDKETGAIYA